MAPVNSQLEVITSQRSLRVIVRLHVLDTREDRRVVHALAGTRVHNGATGFLGAA